MRVQHSCGYGKTTRAAQVAWETTSGECIIHHVTGLCQQWAIRRATTSFRTPCLGRGASSGSRRIRPATLQGASGSYVQECKACTRPVGVIVAGFGWLLSWNYIDSGKRALGHYALLYDRRNHCSTAAICCAIGLVMCLEIEIETLSDFRSDA